MFDPVWAVIVARVGGGAKSRLAASLTADQRRRLALAMLSDILDVCLQARGLIAATLAVVDDPTARALVEQRGAQAILDSATGDMNAAAAAGLDAARHNGAAAALVLPGDVPLISARDLAVLLHAAGNAPRAVVIGSSRDGQGTNALLLRPPDVIAPAFGPPSVGRHLTAGLAAGALARVQPHLGLALDIDTPADLAALDLDPSRLGEQTAAALASLKLVRGHLVHH